MEKIKISQKERIQTAYEVTVVKCNICGCFYEPWATHICKGFKEDMKKIDLPANIKVDDKIMVSVDGIDWIPRHFAKMGDGKVYVWTDGRTSFTERYTFDYAFARLPKKDEVRG